MIILDTNVVSEPLKRVPDTRVVRWLDTLDPDDVALTTVTAAELLYGVALKPPGRSREELGQEVHAILFEEFDRRVEPFDMLAAVRYGILVADHKRNGWVIHISDAQIAAICLVRSAKVATRNVKHFEHAGIEVINPWEL